MLTARKIFVFGVSLLAASFIVAQHPNRKKIDSLEAVLLSAQGIQRIDCFNALSEEYWWPPRIYPDSISQWAIQANAEATEMNYDQGLAASIMHLGVAELYRKNFLSAEKLLRQALPSFEYSHNIRNIGWCNLWLGQTLYGQNNFTDAIACYEKSVPLLQRSNDGEGEGKAYAWMSFLYEATGDYDSSFYYCSKGLMIRQKMSDDVCIAGALVNMGHLYRVAGAYDDALDYYEQGLRYANTHDFNVRTTNWNNVHESIGIVYRLKNMPDSSVYFLQNAIQIDPENEMTRVSLGETYLLQKQYDPALHIFLEPLEHLRKENDRWDLMRVLLDAAKAYKEKNEATTALWYANESLAIAKEANVKQYMKEDYLLLSQVYNQLHRNDSAYFFMQHYTTLKDSIMTSQFVFRLSNYKEQIDFRKEMDQLALLDKDIRIKEGKLKQESHIRWTLIVSLLIAVLSGFIIYRNLTLNRKNERLQSQKKQSELQLRASELEMHALRAQMNPHFIFNCLSSINRFILKNETESASDYLTKFSRLVRMVLTNSNKPFISLEDELDMLRLYLDMERLRFKDSFDYSIRFTNSIDVGNVFIPPLLLQPFAENAIWHGLMHKQGQGHIEIELSADKGILNCIISDNGIGRSKAEMFKSKRAEKQKSMGLKITTERLALLNKNTDEATFFNVEDITDDDGNAAGTRVILKMNYKGLVEPSPDDLITRNI